jgi:pre-mRNA-processing factor 19
MSSSPSSSSAALVLLTCELSGEPVSNRAELVVTPSGHVCRRSLLLSKLAENGGVDPFESPPRPLAEGDLVSLAPDVGVGGTTVPAPPPPSVAAAASVAALLRQARDLHDAALLELFDARRALSETRRELSQALYRNDAAVRVAARLAAERDDARRLLAEWSAPKDGGGGGGFASGRLPAPPPAAAAKEPAAKRQRVEVDASAAAAAKIPEEDLNTMMRTWQELHEQRKQSKKNKGPTKDDVKDYVLQTPRGLLDGVLEEGIEPLSVAGFGSLVGLVVGSTTEGFFKLVLFQVDGPGICQQVAATSFEGSTRAPVTLDVRGSHVVAAIGNLVHTWTWDGRTSLREVGRLYAGHAVHDVQLHPDGRHVMMTCGGGRWLLGRLADLSVAATFMSSEADTTRFSAGALHPDGLIYCVGEESGAVQVWDLKSQSLAGTLQPPAGDEDQGMLRALTISNNGYHVAAAYEHGVVVWDLRKQKVASTMPASEVRSLHFDGESGKLLAAANSDGVDIGTAKGGKAAATATTTTTTRLVPTGTEFTLCDELGFVWQDQCMVFVGSSKAKHDLLFFGKKEE